MRRIHVLAVLAAATGAAVAPAMAQFGSLFDPPRPPTDVPGRAPARQVPPDAYPAQPAYPPQPGQSAPPAFQAAPGRAGVQSQPLPPPPGATAAPPPEAPPPASTFLRPGEAPPAGPAPPPGQPPATGAALAPGDEIITAPPTQKVANPTAVFSGLDKITGRITTFEVAINETVEFGALRVTPRVCYTRPPNETPNTDAFLEVDEITLQHEVRRIFTGWMFAASPGLHAVEHPIYDVWLNDCKGGAPATVVGAKPPEPEAPPAPQQRKPAPRKKR
jgi:hypothetical protein